MIVLHGSWLSRTAMAPASFALWGETSQPTTTTPRPRGRPRVSPGGVAAHAHPFGATAAELRKTLPDPDLGDSALEAQILARLPTLGGEPQPSRPFLRER